MTETTAQTTMPTLTLFPYLKGNTWVFDDPRTWLKEEAFVSGMSEMITRLVETKDIPNAGNGVAVHFSDRPFDGFDAELTWLRSDDSEVLPGKDGSGSQPLGNWYRGNVAGQVMTGWLCKALGLYFSTVAPSRIFVKVEPLPGGVNPIWNVDRNAPNTRRFVSAPDEDSTDNTDE